jgi:hypothetical protein
MDTISTMNRIVSSLACMSLTMLAACSARIPAPQSSTLLPQTESVALVATPTPSPFPATYTVGAGEIFGLDNQFTPNDGNSSTGGQGQTVDGIPCVPTMPHTYHVHSFLGIIINKRQIALPDGTGMKDPEGDITFAGFPNWTEYVGPGGCYYYTHTHDASGVIHIESPENISRSKSIYTLGNYFDVWGRPLSTTQIGPYTGTVRAYVAQVPLKTPEIQRSAYVLYSADPRTIPLYSHTTTWLEIGPNYVPPSALPVIHYYMEY